MALDRAIRHGGSEGSVYDNRGILVFKENHNNVYGKYAIIRKIIGGSKMFSIPYTFANEDECYITIPALKRFAREKKKKILKQPWTDHS